MTRYDIRCQSAPWNNTTIYGSYLDAHKTASIISEECYDLGYITTVDILKEEGPNIDMRPSLEKFGQDFVSYFRSWDPRKALEKELDCKLVKKGLLRLMS